MKSLLYFGPPTAIVVLTKITFDSSILFALKANSSLALASSARCCASFLLDENVLVGTLDALPSIDISTELFWAIKLLMPVISSVNEVVFSLIL